MNSNVILIDDCREDGITLYSPFTGIPYYSEDDVELYSNDEHRDPSLVFCYLGIVGLFQFIRPDVLKIVKAAFNNKHNDNQDMVKNVTKIAESISIKLKTKKNLNTVIFVQTAGYNGMIVSCFEQGYLLDKEWYPLESSKSNLSVTKS